MLDPIARHDFMVTVLAAATDDEVSVLLSSHVLTELERGVGQLPRPAVPGPGAAGQEVNDLLATRGQASLEELAMAYLRAPGERENPTSEVTR